MNSNSAGPRDSFPRNYMLVCGETGQIQRLRGYDCDFAQLFLKRAAGSEIWFWNTFAKPIEGVTREQRHTASATPPRLTPLERLPNELLELILDSMMKSKLSVLALGLASTTLYPKILGRIHRDYGHSKIASWAGKEIGFYGRSAPVPPATLLKFRLHLDSFSPKEEIGPWYHDWTAVSTQPEFTWRRILADAQGRWEELSKSVWRHVDQDLSQEYMYPQNRVWVLRNLSKRQYVRSNRLEPLKAILDDELLPARFRTPRKHGVTGPFSTQSRDGSLDPLTLPQVFIVLTAYSAHPDWREEMFQHHSGPWVSDTFEVLPLEEHLQRASSLDWQDVSIEVAADVGHLRWCVMQHAALSQPGVNGLWEKLKEFSVLVPEARAKWMRWRKLRWMKLNLSRDTDSWNSD